MVRVLFLSVALMVAGFSKAEAAPEREAICNCVKAPCPCNTPTDTRRAPHSTVKIASNCSRGQERRGSIPGKVKNVCILQNLDCDFADPATPDQVTSWTGVTAYCLPKANNWCPSATDCVNDREMETRYPGSEIIANPLRKGDVVCRDTDGAWTSSFMNPTGNSKGVQ